MGVSDGGLRSLHGSPPERDAALASDIDLAAGVAILREKKRVKGKISTRTAPITPKLAKILRAWLGVRPESQFLFCQSQHVARSKTRRDEPTGVTRDEAYDHFKRSLADSKWSVLRGYHVLRHSFISALASEGVDQRVIDEVVGHQSEEQRKRYRHLYPKVMREAINRVFGRQHLDPAPRRSEAQAKAKPLVDETLALERVEAAYRAGTSSSSKRKKRLKVRVRHAPPPSRQSLQ